MKSDDGLPVKFNIPISCLLSLVALFLFYPAPTIHAGNIPRFTIVTEKWEPYNFQKDGVAEGISTDILVLMLKRVGSAQGRSDIKVLPWVRAYKTAVRQPNTILFTTARNEKREKKFKWVGPIFEIQFNIYALKRRQVKINSFKNLIKYKFGTLKDDVTEDLLVKKTGLKIRDFQEVSSNVLNTKKLLFGRIDLVAESKDTAVATCKELGVNPDALESVFVLGKERMYYAFNKETPDAVISLFQKAFDDMNREGKVAEIFHKYGK